MLFSSAPPVEKTTVDDNLLDSALEWLCKHRDVDIKPVKESQAVNGSQNRLQSNFSLNSKLAGKRMSTSEDKVWQAIAGHGIDHKRIPQREFEILSVVAAHGPMGILQPHVTQATGQDKRSVPRRTDMLAEKGYIIKENVVGAGAKTSNLKLKRYANEQPVRSTGSLGSHLGSSSTNGTVIYYDAWFNKTIQLLKENNNIVAVNDLRLHLGMSPRKWEMKILRRCIRRITESGCIRCISAKLHDAEGNPLTYPASGKEQKAQSIQLLREPTEYDRIKWTHSDPRANKLSDTLSDDEDMDGIEEVDAAASGEEGELMEIEGDPDDLDLLKDRIPPQWTPDIPLVNLVYDLVKEAGPAGISSMDLASRLTGPAWRRPLDQIMLLLTDVWQHSQPLHLRHLAIVRDTAVHGKLAHFQFKTYDNFQKSVDSGDASWEAVLVSAKAKGKKKAAEMRPRLDEWGFPVIPLKELASHDGKAASSQDRRRSEHVGPSSDDESADLEGQKDQQQDEYNQAEPEIDNDAQDDGDEEVDGDAVVEDRTEIDGAAQPDVPAATMAQETGTKRRRPYKRREDPSRPGVPLVKKRDIPQHEYDEWESAVETTAQRKVMAEVKASKNANATGTDTSLKASGPSEPAHISVEDLPPERLAQVKEDLVARKKPGIYINPPGARQMKRENFVSRGRPRKALIAVIKTKNLHDFEWFQNDSTPRFAPTPSRRKTTMNGSIPAEAKSPEFVDSYSELDEPTPKKQRLDQSRGEHRGRMDDRSLLGVTTVSVSDSVQGALAATLPTVSSPDTAMSDEGTPAWLSALNGSLRQSKKPTKQHGYTFVPAASTPVSIRQATAPRIPRTDQSPPPVRITGAVGNGLSMLAARNPSHAAGHENPAPLLQSEQTAGGVENLLKVPEPLAAEPVTTSPQPSAAQQLKALKSRRGRRSKETLAQIAQLEKHTEEEQRAENTTERLQAELPVTAGDSAFSVPQPADAAPTQNVVSQPDPQHPSQSQASSQANGSGNFTAANGRLIEIFGKAYVLDHPNETFHHRGGGRYARGPKPSEAKTSAQPAQKVLDGAVVSAKAAPLCAPPTEDATLGPQHGKQPELEAATEREQSATILPSPVNRAEEIEHNEGGQTSSSQQRFADEQVDAEYVEQHPEETFYHRGRGKWVRGLPPPGSTARVAVRGPGADAWKVSMGATPSKAPRPSLQQLRTPAPAVATRRSSRRDQLREDKATVKEAAQSSLVVKLRIPRQYLAALASGSNDLSVALNPAKRTTDLPQKSTLPTPPQDTDSALEVPDKLTPGHSNYGGRPGSPKPVLTTAKATNSTIISSLMIVRPYSDTFDQTSALRPSSPSTPVEPAVSPIANAPSQNNKAVFTSMSEVIEPSGLASALALDHEKALGENFAPPLDDRTDVDEPTVDDQALDITPAMPVHINDTPRPVKKVGTTRTGGNILAQRQKIILDALRACDGVFPGNSEMWYVCVTAWKRTYNQTPDRHTVDNTVKNLLQSKKLKKLQFQFRGKKGQIVQRSIFTEPEIDQNSSRVKNIQKKIIDSYPNVYLPPEVKIEEALRAKANNAFGRRESAKSESDSGKPTAPPTERQSLFVKDDSATVRHTQEASAIEAEQAKQQGFPDVLAYRKHLHDEVKAKRAASQAKATARHREKAAFDRENHNETAGAEQAVVRKLPPKAPIPFFHRKPLSSLRPNAHTVKKARQLRDVEGGVTLEDEARYRLRAASLLQHPTQTFHEASGTFNTSPVVPIQHFPELRTLRSRVVVLDGHEPHRLVRASSNIPSDLVDLLGHARSLSYGDEAQEFFKEIDSVMTWEEQPDTETAASNGQIFINHTLNQPLVYSEPGQSLQATTVPAPSALVTMHMSNLGSHGISPGATQLKNLQSIPPVRPLGTQSLITPEISRRPGKGKRKYTSRKARNVSFDNDAQDSDSEYVPDATSPGSKVVRMGADAKEIADRRDRKSGADFKDVQRLVIAVVLVTTLCGGVHPDRLNWNIVAHAMSFRFDGEFYRRRWDSNKRFRGGEVGRLRGPVREAFLAAYERDELPLVDFQDLSNTDWPSLVTWVEEAVLPKVVNSESLSVPDLPKSREAVEEQFIIQEPKTLFRFNTDEYFTNTTDMGRKHYALRYTHGTLLSASNENNADDLLVLKSWVRAVTMTKQWNYNADAAATKLRTSFSTRMLESVTHEMVEGRMFAQERKGRQLPGRNFIIHNDVLAQFRRWPAKPEEYQFLRQVANAWANINQHFKSHEQLDLVAEASDPEYLVLTNMVAQGQIKAVAMLPPTKDEYDAPFPKLSPWGYAGPSYETKKVNPASLKSPIVYVKTLAYQSQHGLKGDIVIPMQPALKPGEKGTRIPFWVDIHGNLIDDVWDMVLRSIVHLLAFRPGSTASKMQKSHNHKFWDWEIEMVLDWMEKSGIAVRCGDGVEDSGIWKGGWRAGEWWYCAFAPDVATWQPPSAGEVGVQTVA